MIMICAGLIFLVKGIQEKAAAVPQKAVQAAEKAETASETKDQVSDAAPAGSQADAQQTTSSSTAKAAGSTSASAAKEAANASTGSNASSSTEQAQPEKKPSITFAVYDTVSGKCLASMSVEISEGDTAADATMKALNGDYRASGSGESIYFSRIMGISEKSQGPLSGWCFYVNGEKPGVSSGVYKLKSGDSLEWKFLKDGANN